MRLDLFDLRDMPRGDAFLTVTTDARQSLDRAIASAVNDIPRSDPAYKNIQNAATSWNNAKTALDAVPSLLSKIAGSLAEITANRDLNGDAARRRVTAALDNGARLVKAAAVEVTSLLDRVVTLTRTAATPPRPGDTAADEARMANVRTDLRMVLDPMAADVMQLGARMASLLGRAAVDGDQHTVYVLGGTSWAQDYLTARDPRADGYAVSEALRATVEQALDDLNGTNLSAARKAYRAADDSAYAIRVALGQLPSLIEDARDWSMKVAGARY